jgi:hypothetical protein
MDKVSRVGGWAGRLAWATLVAAPLLASSTVAWADEFVPVGWDDQGNVIAADVRRSPVEDLPLAANVIATPTPRIEELNADIDGMTLYLLPELTPEPKPVAVGPAAVPLYSSEDGNIQFWAP